MFRVECRTVIAQSIALGHEVPGYGFPSFLCFYCSHLLRAETHVHPCRLYLSLESGGYVGFLRQSSLSDPPTVTSLVTRNNPVAGDRRVTVTLSYLRTNRLIS